ncbi:MAG: hypothetical protein H0U53_01275 [Actinobacteria bacterium]|nr:hypothetical protein [Actinomycetota bacterium]
MSSDLETTLDHLYGLPLADFTSARDELIRKLRDSGQKEAAAETSGLRKPNLAAWAVNQLARHCHSDLQLLLESRDTIRQAENAEEVRDLSEKRRQLVARLLERGREILIEAGHAASPSHLELMRRTLEAGASREERQMLLKGRLTRDLEPSGFEHALPLGIEPPEETEVVQEEEQRRIKELESAADAAEQEADCLEQQAAKAQAVADLATQQAAEARRRARSARHEARGAQGIDTSRARG